MHDYQREDKVHRRWNPLTGEWVLVSPHRTKRPWSGQKEQPDTAIIPDFDPDCYLCPGNSRAAGVTNPPYASTFVFENDFGALLPDESEPFVVPGDDELLRAEPESGICKVICYSPRHDLTMARMDLHTLEGIISTWQQEYRVLRELATIGYVQIFENRGHVMGCSNAHPHGQIWATSSIPTIPAMESRQQLDYLHRKGSCLLCDYIARESREGRRILFSNSSFIALVPFWALWPYETMVLPRRHVSAITEMTEKEKVDLATILKSLTICYDNLFSTSFPYSMGIHQQPTKGDESEAWHFHIHFLPPLLRSKSVKKHMVGFELLAMPQRDLTAEMAADTLRDLPVKHHLDEGS